MLFVRTLPLALVVAVLALWAPATPAAARPVADEQICFPDVPGIDDCIDPVFSAFWRANGGLAIFGYPIGPATTITPPGGGTAITVQWFERNRLELHPDKRAPYRVLLGRVGADRLAQLGRDHWADGGEPGPQPGCLWFAETRQNICDQARGAGFKSYWEANGVRIAGLSRYERSLALFGLPLTAANPEPGPDGSLILTQWFERARFEWQADQAGRFRVYLGLLGNEAVGGAPLTGQNPLDASIYGVEVNRDGVAPVAGRIGEAQIGWVRYNGVNWAEIEPRQGERNWEALAGVEAELAAISAAGGTPMLVVRGAPAWAQAARGSVCGPIKAEALPDFAAFMGELVTRLSKPPFQVKHWELGNEPDADRNLVGGDSVFGCWGDARQPDNGAGEYAAMLKAAYPAIKAADPQAKVILGGLLLACDPTLAGQARPCASGNFFENVLKSGAGQSFDILAYHSYTYWLPSTQDWDLTAPGWEHRGGLMLGKLSFLNEVMARYGLKKPVVMNEGGLLCFRNDPVCGPAGFYEAQANYAVRMYVRAQAAGLAGAIWYTLNGPGWQEGGLLDAAQQPRPAFETLRFIAPRFAGAQVVGASVDGPLERYTLSKGNTRYEILWTNDSSTRTVPAPPGARQIYTYRGEPRPLSATLTVGFAPVIVEASAAP